MKTIGLLGGMSWESSIAYYRDVNEGVRTRLGGGHSAECVMYSFDFHRIHQMQDAGDWEGAAGELVTAARWLEAAGAEIIVLCTNTMHRVAEEIANGIGVPLLHIADATAEAARAAGVTRPLLLGTRHTMEGDFYATRMERLHGLPVEVPDAAERRDIHEIIYGELVRGVIASGSRDRYLEIIERHVADRCDGVIAGCTEIELLIGPSDLDVPLIPSAAVHAAAAVEAALA